MPNHHTMRRFFRKFWLPFYRKWVLRHIRREQVFRYGHLRLTVPPGVFHPGVFFSTVIFLRFLKKVDFKNKTVLDVGTGSGALALLAAQNGAIATALDINPLAVETVRRNAAANGLSVFTCQSDLFDGWPPQFFEYILINPPYYPLSPKTGAEQAFYAGENLEYFEKLFRQLPGYLQATSHVWMILSEDCDLEKIQELAGLYRFRLSIVFEQKKWGERLMIFEANAF